MVIQFWLKMLFTALYGLEVILYIEQIGEPRKPITKRQASFHALFSVALLFCIWYWL